MFIKGCNNTITEVYITWSSEQNSEKSFLKLCKQVNYGLVVTPATTLWCCMQISNLALNCSASKNNMLDYVTLSRTLTS